MELDAPNIGEIEQQYLSKVIKSSFVSTFGPYVGAFEKGMSAFVSAPSAVAVQSGTAALHMALYELGIGPGDEVIVPVLTFIASVNPVKYVGATPVFVDIDPRTWNIDVVQVENAITPKTKAIIPVHLYGNPCAMDAILKIANKHHLYIIEDATESLGATYDGKGMGTFGEFGCLSFNGNKTITTAGGGMVIGKDSRRIEHIRFLVNQGRDESRGYFHPEIGFNFRMTNLQAGLGLAQMERLPEFLEIKKKFFEIYRNELKSLSRVHFQEEPKNASSSWWFTCVLIDDVENMADLQKRLKEKGIPTRRFFMPLVEFPMYKGTAEGCEKYPSAYAVYEKGLCLPSSTLNSAEDIKQTAKVLKEELS